MRFMNWDVLLFPDLGDTKTPLQEFRTVCEVVEEPGPEHDQICTASQPPCLTATTHPVVTVFCYVPSLSHSCPFRVSIHSWSAPVASNATVTVAPHKGIISFEARLLLDGNCVAGVVFDTEPSWPHIIDCTSQTDEHGNIEHLKFPTFHKEILHQTWVDPAQNLGRIKVVINEGFHQAPSPSGFEKTRTVVIFAFQHAPLPILQDTGIAWPNNAMFYQASRSMHNPLSPRRLLELDPDTHAHSPRRQEQAIRPQARSKVDTTISPPEMPRQAQETTLTRQPLIQNQMIAPYSPYKHDPFVEMANLNELSSWRSLTHNTSSSNDIAMVDHLTVSSGSRDQSMPDYSRPISPATSSLRSCMMPDFSRPLSPASLRSELLADISRPLSLASSRQASDWENLLAGVGPLSRGALLCESNSHDRRSLPRLESDPDFSGSQFNELMASRSPPKVSSSGTFAPANTRVSSAANTPPTGSKPSAAAEARASSYTGVAQRPVSITIRDKTSPTALSASEKNARNRSTSRTSTMDDESTPRPQPIVTNKPSVSVKGKKEGRCIEFGLGASSSSQRRLSTVAARIQETENAQKSKMNSTLGGDSKRRRVSNVVDLRNAEAQSCSGSLLPSRSAPNILNDESPKKIDNLDDLAVDGVVARTAFEPRDNIL